jgi:aryl-alcohol dehydrogenase-like predicted oxidoreductase
MSANRLALGAAQWGLDYGIANRTGRPDDGAVAEILAVAKAAGVNTIDTAKAYGDSEAVIGRLVGDDDGWKIGTKLAPDLFAGAPSPAEAAQRTRASLDSSLRTLRRDTLDSVLLHRWTEDGPVLAAVLDVLAEARERKTLVRAGASVLTPAEGAAAWASQRIQQIQCPAHLLDSRFPLTGREGVAVHTRSAFFQGVAFLDPERLPPHLEPIRALLEQLQDLGRALHQPPATLWLAHALSLPTARVVVGCERPEQLAANLEALRHVDAVSAEVARFVAARQTPDDAVLDPWRWPPRA